MALPPDTAHCTDLFSERVEALTEILLPELLELLEGLQGTTAFELAGYSMSGWGFWDDVLAFGSLWRS